MPIAVQSDEARMTPDEVAAHMAVIMERFGPWQKQRDQTAARNSTTRFFVKRNNMTRHIVIVLPDYQPPAYPDPGWSEFIPATGDQRAVNVMGDNRWCLGFDVSGADFAFDHRADGEFTSVFDGPEVQTAREKLREWGFPNPRRAT